MIRINDFKYSITNDYLIDFNNEVYKHFNNSENCINLIKYNPELENVLLEIIDILKSMDNKKSLNYAKTLLSEYYNIKESLCN